MKIVNFHPVGTREIESGGYIKNAVWFQKDKTILRTKTTACLHSCWGQGISKRQVKLSF